MEDNAGAATPRYAKIERIDGRDVLLFAPRSMPERLVAKQGFIPFRLERPKSGDRRPGTRLVRQAPVVKDGAVVLAYVYESINPKEK